MPAKKRKRTNQSRQNTADDGDDQELDFRDEINPGEEEVTVVRAAETVGFHDPEIPRRLYTCWRSQVHRGIQLWDCFGPGEAGINRWDYFCEWAAAQPSMAPKGQLSYHNATIRQHVHTLCEDIAKKARVSRQTMWDTIAKARAAYRGANPSTPAHFESPTWRWKDVEELGRFNAGPPYMPRTPRGSGATLLSATAASNETKDRMVAHKVGPVPGRGDPVLAPPTPDTPSVIPASKRGRKGPAGKGRTGAKGAKGAKRGKGGAESPIDLESAGTAPTGPVTTTRPAATAPKGPVTPARPPATTSTGPSSVPARSSKRPPPTTPASSSKRPALNPPATAPVGQSKALTGRRLPVTTSVGSSKAPAGHRPPATAPTSTLAPPILPPSSGSSKVAGGPLAMQKLMLPPPVGGPSAYGPPTSVRIHIITPHNHTEDPVCKGWIFSQATLSYTVTLLQHTMVELRLRTEPHVPWEQGAMGRIVHFYALENINMFKLLEEDFWLGVFLIKAGQSKVMMDIQVELAPSNHAREPPPYRAGTAGSGGAIRGSKKPETAKGKAPDPKGKGKAVDTRDEGEDDEGEGDGGKDDEGEDDEGADDKGEDDESEDEDDAYGEDDDDDEEDTDGEDYDDDEEGDDR